jgi:erythromycin esterase
MNHSNLNNEILKKSVPFVGIKDFSHLINYCKDKQVVMLGESTHGTKQFYEWRSQISAELIQKHGFDFIAVEGDWPPCQAVNSFVQHRSNAGSFETLHNFSRWPTWMWANKEMVNFMDWLQEWNLDSTSMAGFHGLDVYSLYESMDVVIHSLQDIDPDLALKAKKYYSCFDPYRHNEKAYAKSLFNFPEGCREKVRLALDEILNRAINSPGNFFNITQNAKIIKDAEKYYRAMVLDGEDNSWNIRDKHMLDTLEQLLNFYGPSSKGIVWAHNTHVGDYRATDMGLRGEVNLGGLARIKLGPKNVALVGFTTYSGTVMASHSWDGTMQVMDVPPGKLGSLEYHLHDCVPYIGNSNYYLLLDEVNEGSPLLDYRGHRAIGVLYDPKLERLGNYVPTSVAGRYDALVFLDETEALSPLYYAFDKNKIPETYPYGGRL